MLADVEQLQKHVQDSEGPLRDYIDIIDLNNRFVSSTFSSLDKETRKWRWKYHLASKK